MIKNVFFNFTHDNFDTLFKRTITGAIIPFN